MQYKSCKTFITKQVDYDLEYCRTDWSSLVNYVAFYCQAGPQDAHGGNCVAADQRWFVQIQSSSG
ncbi:hypothetical protein BV25DRAFT_1822634 [Artomyces pyxidatus]|uniref:Uncharacterized protein n=1 Tax=Artomyces pyxidatus TaxID=48021 RepID=A0ACB8T8R5_9AGAM|nr:hypothetical protein BV25DRAFT_1822634 [Artomyces pyxidatus]